MKFLVFGFLALAALGLVAALIIGVALKIVGLLFLALVVVAAVSLVMSRFRGTLNLNLDDRLPRAYLPFDRSADAERMPR